MADLDRAWLVERPIAHRGLHDRLGGIAENSLSAARAAIAKGYAIECDIQRSADGEAMVFHDASLERLTGRSGDVGDEPAVVLNGMALRGTSDVIPTLRQLLDLIEGRVPLICEIKSTFQADGRLADRALEVARDYRGPLAFKSFDPFVLSQLRAASEPAFGRPCGIVAEASYDDPEWRHLASERKRDLAALSHWPETRPDFVSYNVRDLPHAAATLCRFGLGIPVVTWTVRTAEQVDRAARWADQMVFEGLAP